MTEEHNPEALAYPRTHSLRQLVHESRVNDTVLQAILYQLVNTFGEYERGDVDFDWDQFGLELIEESRQLDLLREVYEDLILALLVKNDED